MIQNDAMILGLLFLILGFVFWSESSEIKIFKTFYKYVPSLLLCYFLPGFLNSFGIINTHDSKLYFMSSRYLLPASLLLLTISVDLKAILKLGPKAIIMFFTGTFGVILGAPIALILTNYFFKDGLGEINLTELAKGLTTIAGSWIGGGANQASMKEIYEVPNNIFSMMIIVDVFVANIWMGVLLYFAGRTDKVDQFLKADTSALIELKDKITKSFKYKNEITTKNLMIICSVAFFLVGISHITADYLGPFIKENYPSLEKFSLTSSFFWLIMIITFIGILLSFTKLKKIEELGASRVGNVFLYVLIATIGMHMDLFEIMKAPYLILLGMIWMGVHAILMVLIAKLIRAPYFYLAVGSQANIGGAASAPVVASVFHPSLASVGVLLAILGYAVGTYGAWICGIIMLNIV